MDLATAIDETERFLTVWRTGRGPDRGRLHDIGSVIIAASLDHNAPELTTTHLETLLNALHAARENAPAKPCTSHAHREFVGDQDVPCRLPAGHEFHRNGKREWTP